MKSSLILIILSIIIFSSCKKNLEDKFDAINKNQTSKAAKTSELKVAENFDWKTNKKSNIKLVATENYPAVIFTMEGELITKTMVFAAQENIIPVTTNSTQKQIRVVFMEKEYVVNLSTENITLQLN